MIASSDFVKQLNILNLSPFLMVPCSIFKHLNYYLINNQTEVIYPPNEAHAMGFVVGTYSATGQPAVIFMQNSGLNNIANAQTSLHALYKIPALLVISWRGEKSEAPEHDLMGKNLKAYLKLLKIPFRVLSEKGWEKSLKEMASLTRKTRQPAAVIVRKGFFEEEEERTDDLSKRFPLSRYEAIKIIKNSFKNEAVFVSTNGHPTRDSFGVSPTPDFYMMGSMGHAFSVGAGTAWALNGRTPRGGKRKVVVFDGDGGCLMHLGSLALVNLVKQTNLIYVVLDNEAYESTGSQPCLSEKINFAQIAKGLGFPQVYSIKGRLELKKTIKSLKPNQVAFIHIKVNRKKAKAPRVSDKYTCQQIANRFAKRLRSGS
ncbi:thiamine pyrophosphate-dependent enzyme [Patescibacteria group bacterium]